MGRLVDISGQRFGRLQVSHRDGVMRGQAAWVCTCDCGEQARVPSYRLRTGETQSCGCLHREISSQVYTNLNHTHGMTRSREYKSWQQMHQRCSNPKSHAYVWYGARGISVCDRWSSFESFYADMGERPAGTSLDRIDVNGNYEPDNCRWATPLEQNRNRRPRASA